MNINVNEKCTTEKDVHSCTPDCSTYYMALLSLPHTFGPLKAKTHKVCKLLLIPDVLRREHHKTVPHNTTFFDVHWYNRAGIT